jgi:porphobilinogen synthase
MSYTAKFASVFYGPFRHVVNAAQKSLDKKQYQLSPLSRFEPELEILSDIQEQAEALLTKPASHYLGLVNRAQQLSAKPVGVGCTKLVENMKCLN